MKGRISISRFMSNRKPERGISITVEDESSGVRFLDLTLSAENFGNAVTGLGSLECEFELRGTDLVGLKQEHKEESVAVPEFPGRLSDKQISLLLAPYEVDGWMGRGQDLNNHHRYDNKSKTVRVTFFRYVAAPTRTGEQK